MCVYIGQCEHARRQETDVGHLPQSLSVPFFLKKAKSIFISKDLSTFPRQTLRSKENTPTVTLEASKYDKKHTNEDARNSTSALQQGLSLHLKHPVFKSWRSVCLCSLVSGSQMCAGNPNLGPCVCTAGICLLSHLPRPQVTVPNRSSSFHSRAQRHRSVLWARWLQVLSSMVQLPRDGGITLPR